MLLPESRVLDHEVPVTASHCCCLHRHTLMPCATFRSPHTLLNFFDIGCWQIKRASHSCCQAPNLP
ncbi:unnamed protein product [Staurois parvus]|uniref:Uncharacterized protein n=1 Tax=Staurois parvus TaxID=386267 RepID=A0ABN9GGL6_9NEOB|nr:unnamed protein product [Staurois parvus]